MNALLKTDCENRLARVAGQVGALQRMLEDGRACSDMLQQVKAVRSALDQLGILLLTEHLESCVLHVGSHDEPVCDVREVDRPKEIRDTLTRFLK